MRILEQQRDRESEREKASRLDLELELGDTATLALPSTRTSLRLSAARESTTAMVRDHSNPKTLAKSAKAQATGVKTGNLRTKGESSSLPPQLAPSGTSRVCSCAVS